jgi:hypothetical protein
LSFGGFNQSSQRIAGDCDGTSEKRSDRAGRKVLRDRLAAPVARRVEFRAFWASMSAGQTSEAAAIDAGVSPAVGARWFRRAGGMAPSHLSTSANSLSDRYLSFAEREGDRDPALAAYPSDLGRLADFEPRVMLRS